MFGARNMMLTSGLQLDADARAYIAAVEAADGNALETAVKLAYNTFIVGIKADASVSTLASHPIKSACILAGARTLTGALIPLVGTAPTNNNFVSGDYNRETGLIGNGTTKYLSTNRANNVSAQNSRHQSVYVQATGTDTTKAYVGSAVADTSGSSQILGVAGDSKIAARLASGVTMTSAGNLETAGFIGISRSSSANFIVRSGATSETLTNTSATPNNQTDLVFARNLSGTPTLFADCRLQWYSTGDAVDLSSLRTRLDTLIADLAAAIP
jgi:hypothetical protein